MAVRLTTGRLVLRSLRESDAKSIYDNANDHSVSRYIPGMPYPYTVGDTKKFIQKSKYEASSGQSYVLGMELKSSRKVIGTITIHLRDSESRTGEVGYWVGKNYRGMGLATEALEEMKNFCFNDLGLENLYAKVFEPNVASAGLLKKCGFEQDAEHSEVIEKDGRMFNHLKFNLSRRPRTRTGSSASS